MRCVTSGGTAILHLEGVDRAKRDMATRSTVAAVRETMPASLNGTRFGSRRPLVARSERGDDGVGAGPFVPRHVPEVRT
jgi:hypothetical protein